MSFRKNIISIYFTGIFCLLIYDSLFAVTVSPNIPLTTDPGRQNETTIAIDPNNPLRLVGGARDGHDGCAVYTTGEKGGKKGGKRGQIYLIDIGE